MRAAVILALFGAMYAYQVYENVLKDTGASQNTVCPLSEQLFEFRVPSVVACAYLCGCSPLGCKGTSYDEPTEMCYGCRNTPDSTAEVFGTETGVVFYSVFVGCNEPPTVDNATLLAGGTSEGTVRRYTCVTDYYNHARFTGMSVTCQANGSWSTAMFQCLPGYPEYFREVGQMVLKFGLFLRPYTTVWGLCDKYGALAKIDTIEKQTDLEVYFSGMSKTEDFFIQGTRGDVDYVWRYDNGEVIPQDKLFWVPEGPNNGSDYNCIVLKKDSNWKWADIPCDSKNFFICEYFEKD